MPHRQVKYWKSKLGLTWIQTGGARPLLPSIETLEALWADDPCLTVDALAKRYGICARTMRSHLAAVGFRPEPVADDAPVMEALSKLVQRGWCSNIGVGFAEACLRREFGILASAKQIRRCLRVLDPASHKLRAKAAAKTKYRYTVGGPRSLYHADAHEKLAKIWGMWIHLLIDGYSRYILYLTVTTDKLAETVRQLFVQACTAYGWALGMFTLMRCVL